MKVRIMVGASATYLYIITPSKSLGVKLDGGMSTIKAAQRAADEMLAKAAKLVERAQFIEAAIAHMNAENEAKTADWKRVHGLDGEQNHGY